MTDRTHPDSGRIITSGDVLRELHEEIETLRMGYAAARLEIESLKSQLAERASRGQSPAQASPAAVAWPVAVLKFERGTPGRENEMPRVVSCNWMPDGEYEVYLAAAPTTQPAHQQEAQEPVAVVVPCHTPSGKRVALYSAKQDLPIGTQLYTAPQPSPAAQVDALDAERYRWLAASCRSTSEHWGGRWSIIIDGPAPKSHDSEDDFDAAIDAARAAQEGR